MISSGLSSIDKSLDTGSGLPPNSIVEISGVADSGKTALALWFCKEALRNPDCLVGWVVSESTITKPNMEWSSVVSERFVVGTQSYDYPGLELAVDMINGGCNLVVVDSIAALLGDSPESTLISVIGKYLPKLRTAVDEHGSIAILLNQDRSVGIGRVVEGCGSSPVLNRLLDYRIRLTRGIGIYSAGEPIGFRVHFNITRNGPNVDNWGRSGRYTCYYSKGLKDIRGA